MILTKQEAQQLSNKILALSKADSCVVGIEGSQARHIRYAQNFATTSGAPGGFSISITSNFGTRSASISTGQMDDDTLAATVAEVDRLARIAPEDPEFMPPLGQQIYGDFTAGYAQATADATSSQLAGLISPILSEAESKKVIAAGFLETTISFSSLANSTGLFAYDRFTNVEHSITARTPVDATPGKGSGWAGSNAEDITKFDVAGQGSRAIDKALKSQGPIEVEPDKFTVILEPAAVADLLSMMMWEFDQRATDEGRSFCSKPKKQSRLGEQIFAPIVNIYSDPASSLAPGRSYADDGLPAQRTDWVKNGILQNLSCSRYWAKKTNRQPLPGGSSLVMTGGTTSTDEMIQQTKRGLLITRLWYIRMVDPQTVLLTGLTRDGVFLIDHGAIYKPTQNFRFNHSPVELLKNVKALGPTERTHGSETDGMAISAPTILSDGFNLTSISDAV